MRLPPFKIERYYARYEFTAPYMLSSSDCESMTIRELLALEPDAEERFAAHWLGYTEAPGDPALRQAIASLYTNIDPAQVLVFAGAEEGIFATMNALLTSGDHVIVHAPGYQSLHTVASAAGCQVTPWLTGDGDGWELDLDWLQEHIRPRTRMIVINSPHNPTGYALSAEKQQKLVEIAKARGIILFSDEVYRGLEYAPADRLPAAADLYDRALSLGVLSKTYGLPGLRIGWIATRDAELYRRLAEFKDYTTICNSAPSEFLATIAMRHHEALAARNRDICLENLKLLDAFFDRHSALFSWQRPRAGSIGFARVNVPEGAERFAVRVVDGCGCLFLPSTMFDYGDHHVRVGFGRKNLPEALDRLDAFLSR
jgi:aspartate/methionine/tyrosine aminotransferase